MNDFARSVLTYGFITIVVLVSLHIWVSYQAWRRAQAPGRFLLLVAISPGTTALWSAVAMGALLIFALCSSCFPYNSPQADAYWATFGLPLRWPGLFVVADFSANRISFFIVAGALYVLGIASSLFLEALRGVRRKHP